MIVGIFGIFDLQKTKAAECGGDVVCACGDTVIASTTLMTDLDCSSGGNGLIVGANGITIDGNNNTISGSSNPEDPRYGIYNFDYSGVTVENLEISRFDYGLYFYNAISSIIMNNIFSFNNSTGARFFYSSSSSIMNNTLSFNDTGILLSYSPSSIIINNVADSNSSVGFSIGYSDFIILTNNISNSNSSGIYIDSSNVGVLASNTTNYNNSYGISVYNSSSSTIISNISDSNQIGINFNSVIYSTIINNSVNLNYYGILISNSNSKFNTIENNNITNNIEGLNFNLASLNNIINNYIFNNAISSYENASNSYFDNSFFHNLNNKMLTFIEMNRKININDIVTSTISIFDVNGVECPDCIYSISLSPSESITTNKIKNNATSTFIARRSGIYSLTYTIADLNDNITKRNFSFFVDANATTTTRYYLRGVQATHGQPIGNGDLNDAQSMLLTPPISKETWYCSFWVQNSVDKIPDYPLSSISDIDINTWYKIDGEGYMGIQKIVSYDGFNIDLSSNISTTSEYAWIDYNFNDLDWSINYAKNWYLLTTKISTVSPMNPGYPAQHTTPSQPSYVDFTYQYTTTPAIKSISNENIIVLSATAPVDATSSASIVLDNPNTSATSTTLVLTDFKRPFLGATSIIDSTSTTTLTTTIGASSSSTLDAVAMDIVPSYGSVSISIDTWNTTGTYYKKWSEEGSGHDISTQHTISDLRPNTDYIVKVGGVILDEYTSNSSGEIIFTYEDGYSTKEFEVIDNASPVITILGSNPVSIYVGDNYTDSGAIALDNVDGDITNSIVVTNTVNTSVVGSYTVTYNVSDTASNPATQVVRVVNVLNRPGGGIPLYMLNIMNQQNQDNQVVDNNNNNNNNQTTIKDNQIFKYSNDNKVYLLDNGVKRWIKDEESFNLLGYKWSDIKIISDNTIVYPNGIDLEVIKPVFAFTKILKLRSFGSDVIQLQTILKRLGYFTYPRITNYYGSYTSDAVGRFQKANKLKATGAVDKATMNKLNSLLVY